MRAAHDFFLAAVLTTFLLLSGGTVAVRAGDIDSHLTATYFMARQVGYTHREALTIAKGNWSVDLNGMTSALPLKDLGSVDAWIEPKNAATLPSNLATTYNSIKHDLNDPSRVGNYDDRGRRFHALGSSPEEARANLVQLQRDFQASKATGDTRLVQLGQYLHAVQDSYFHQTSDNKPFSAEWGHASKFHAPDMVDKNPLTAMRANLATYEVLKQFKDNSTLPPVPEASQIYRAFNDNDIRRLVANESQSKTVALTNEIVKSYEGGELNKEKLAKNVEKVWGGQKSRDNPFAAPTYLDSNSKFKIDYDGKDANAILKDTSPKKTITVAVVGSGGVPVVTQVQVRDPGGPMPGTAGPANAAQQPTGSIPTSATPGAPGQPTAPKSTVPKSTVPTSTAPTTTVPTTTVPTTPPNTVAQAGKGLPPAMMLGGAKPGGISLNVAAAHRLSMKLDLESVYTRDGRVVLSGKSGGAYTVDAALFLTAMRAACEMADPYMSLDPDNGQAWTEETSKAGKAVWEQIKGDFGVEKPVTADAKAGLTLRTVSVRRDYPQIWAKLAPNYPNLNARLVFRPAWLRDTRFGEIMYVADVLLKELSAGTPAVVPGFEVRALKIDNYQSANVRRVLRSLQENVGSLPSSAPAVNNWRLWFDLAPDGRDATYGSGVVPAISMLDDGPPQANDPASLSLRSQIKAHGLEVSAPSGAKLIRTLSVADNAFDISQVWPQMFVRGHDHVTRQDVKGVDEKLSALAHDVNQRIATYAAAYEELRDLTEIFRLYVAAVGIVNRSATVCESIKATPLLRSEKVAKPLPEHRPTELTVTVASYTHADQRGRQVWYSSARSYDGGVSPRGREFFERQNLVQEETTATREIKQQAAAKPAEASWSAPSGRQFVALNIDSDDEYVKAMRELKAFKPVSIEVAMARYPQLAALAATGSRPTVGGGLLDDEPSTQPSQVAPPTPSVVPRGGGMLDDVDAAKGGIVRVPRH